PPPVPRAGPAPPATASVETTSWRQRQLLLEFARTHRLAVARTTALEPAGVGERADDHRLEAGIAHQARGHLHRCVVVAGDGNRKLRCGAVRLTRQDHVGHRVERAYQTRAGQVLA